MGLNIDDYMLIQDVVKKLKEIDDHLIEVVYDDEVSAHYFAIAREKLDEVTEELIQYKERD